MKKILIFILTFFVLTNFVKAQYPLTQNIGSDSTLVISKGALKSRLITQTFSDTTAANLQRIRQYAAAMIYTTSDEQVWFRNSTATQWLPITSTNIYNIYNTSVTNVSVFNQIDSSVTISICTGAGSCDTTTVTTNVTYKIGATVSFIDSSHVLICGTDSATNIQSCDTLSIPPQKLYVFQNGLTEIAAGVVELGGTLAKPVTINLSNNTLGLNGGTLQYQDAAGTYSVGGNVLTNDATGNASWQPIPGQSASGGTYIISGLNVVWDSLLTFDVTAGTYMINGNIYHSNFTVVTLDTLIGTDPRRDEIIADTLGVVSKITGTPSSDPAAPTPNPLSQIGITDVLINAGDNVPANVTQGFIYNEGTGTAGGEWDTASSISAARFRNTAHPYNGTYDLYVPSFTNNATITFTDNTTVDLSTFTSVSYAIRLNSTFSNNSYLSLRWYNGNTAVSNAINVRTGNYGWVRTTINNYQHVAVSMSAFTFSSYTANKLVITLVGSNSSGFYFDYLQIQTNVGQPQTGNGLNGLTVNNLNPLFNLTTTVTNNVATVTNTQQNATAYRVFGNFTNSSAAPTFGQIDLSTSVVTGLLPVANLAPGSENQILQIQSGIPTWVDASPPTYDTVFTVLPIGVHSGATNDTLFLQYTNGLTLKDDSLAVGGSLTEATRINTNGNTMYIQGVDAPAYKYIIQKGTTSSPTALDILFGASPKQVIMRAIQSSAGTTIAANADTTSGSQDVEVNMGSNDGTGDSQFYIQTDANHGYLFNLFVEDGVHTGISLSGNAATQTIQMTAYNGITLDATQFLKVYPIAAAFASALTPAEGMIVFVSSTNGTFTSIGLWDYENSAWHKL